MYVHMCMHTDMQVCTGMQACRYVQVSIYACGYIYVCTCQVVPCVCVQVCFPVCLLASSNCILYLVLHYTHYTRTHAILRLALHTLLHALHDCIPLHSYSRTNTSIPPMTHISLQTHEYISLHTSHY